MGGGLMQLVAYGAQDIYLTGNPQITFFKVVYRRHTNFAMEAVAQTFEGVAAAGACVSATISRNGDLVHRGYLECADNSNSFTEAIIDNVELEIGGQLIDRHYGDWMNIWVELTHSETKKAQYDDLSAHAAAGHSWIPLQFSFCRNPGLAIPLIALQYHEVKLNFRFKNEGAGAGNFPSTVCLWCDYIYLDTDERRRFAQTSHEYLIEQVQANRQNTLATGCVNKIPLTFNHPVKELVWKPNEALADADNNKWGSCGLKLNGHERFAKRTATYFTRVQKYQHHTGEHAEAYATTIAGNATVTANSAGALATVSSVAPTDLVHTYSFALQPEEHQPSGTCNFSRIDNAVLEIESHGSASCVDVYAVNYNVLRVMSGMGGLAYSN